MFQKATKTQSKLRLALSGPSGSGKTYSALAIAQHLGKTIALLDTEHGSASKYADRFDFDVCNLDDFHPSNYIKLIKAASSAEYDVIIIDSLSHAWFWELDQTSKAANSFMAWGNVRPLERALVDAMLGSPSHVIATMRTKTEWVIEENAKGKAAPRKIGTAPIQASNIEYEFDLAGELDLNHILTISKSRCPDLSNTTHHHPSKELADRLINWLTDGSPAPESAQSKCDRVKAAREEAGVDTESVRILIKNQFGRTSPKQLTSEQCDQIIELISQR
ncbi:MAG: AAA family ATPase [Leptolyngbyaceae cyanobacterium RU_5_1]|nr:AAA family ATPase [Leptolyngbyaceae cyanobacterium RU_5_1]